MKWEEYVTVSENVLGSPHVPSSLQIITLIKKVNPTKLMLSEKDRERGYLVKSRLQSLLLEHYGDSFNLVPHPASPNIILIKHRALPSIDACHANEGSLSPLARERTEVAAPLFTLEEKKKSAGKGRREAEAACSAKDVLKKATALLDRYDYVAAEDALAGLRVNCSEELPVLMRAAGIMLHEIGAYQLCIDTVLNQGGSVLKDSGIREMLALAYFRNGCIPESRAIFEELHPAELGLESLMAYAEIAFKDGSLVAAMELVALAKKKEGYLSGLGNLEKEIASALSAQAEPVLQKAQAMFRSGATDEARRLANEALALNPACQEARSVLSAIEARDEKARLAGLWARLETETDGEVRIALLAQLMERDKEQKEVARKLLAQEKKGQRQKRFDEQLDALHGLVLRKCWSECFESVTSLMRQPEYAQRADDVLSLSPLFCVLHENKRLNGINARAAKELWLRFARVKTALAAGDCEGCFETMQELKQWFKPYPQFSEDYHCLLQAEQEKARKEIAAMVGSAGTPECTANELQRICAGVKKRMAVLPAEERRGLVRTMEGWQTRLMPEEGGGGLVEEYREALLLGNGEKAAYLRRGNVNIPALDALDAEFAAAFRIDVEPLALEICDTLPIDLTSRLAFELDWLTETKVFLTESDGTVVMVDFAEQRACRMTSPVFADVALVDSINGKTFLFRELKGEEEYGTKLWRAELSVEGGRFTASFDMRERFEIGDGFCEKDVWMASDKDTDYYLLAKHEEGHEPAKVLRIRLGQKSAVQSLQLGSLTELRMWRWYSSPDRFIVGGDGQMRHVNHNLATKATLVMTPDIFKADTKNGCIYGLDNYWLTKRNKNLELIKAYECAYSLGLWGAERTFGVSFETDTVLVAVGGKQQSFYNLSSNKFSEKVKLGRVLPFNRDGRWYCYHYNREERKLRLRDITADIHDILQWREIFSPRWKSKKSDKSLLWFGKRGNFMYRSQDWCPDEVGAEEAGLPPEGEACGDAPHGATDEDVEDAPRHWPTEERCQQPRAEPDAIEPDA